VGLHTSNGPDSKPVETRGTYPAIISVVVLEPVIDFLNVLVPVVVVGGWESIGLEPDKLGRVENGCNDQFILSLFN
jgi:hypothetical protein